MPPKIEWTNTLYLPGGFFMFDLFDGRWGNDNNAIVVISVIAAVLLYLWVF